MQFRLRFDAETGCKGALTITEWRIAGSTARNDFWETPEWEAGVAIAKIKLTTKGGFNLTSSPHSVVSLHALGRWQERSGKRDDASLIADLLPLLTTNEPERVRCGSGTWLANLIDTHLGGLVYRTRDVRTFVP